MFCLMLCLCMLTAVMPGCAPKQQVNAAAIDVMVRDMAARDKAYINADKTLSDLQKRTYLRTGEILTGIMDEAMGRNVTTPPAVPFDNAAIPAKPDKPPVVTTSPDGKAVMSVSLTNSRVVRVVEATGPPQ